MDKAKEEAGDGKTPFERMTGFTRKIIQVPKSELPRREPKPHKRRKKPKS